MRQRHLLALVVVLDQVAQRVRGVQQRQHGFAAGALAARQARQQRVQPLGVFVGQQGDALVLQQVQPRRPARTFGQVRQQAVVLDVDVARQRPASALPLRARALEVAAPHV